MQQNSAASWLLFSHRLIANLCSFNPFDRSRRFPPRNPRCSLFHLARHSPFLDAFRSKFAYFRAQICVFKGAIKIPKPSPDICQGDGEARDVFQLPLSVSLLESKQNPSPKSRTLPLSRFPKQNFNCATSRTPFLCPR